MDLPPDRIVVALVGSSADLDVLRLVLLALSLVRGAR